MSEAITEIVESRREVKLAQKDVDRFWSKVNKDGPVPTHCPEIGNCWVWMLSVDREGYGNFKMQGRIWRSHRAAMVIANGIEPPKFVLHHCDNPSCVRPSHLFEGTVKENWDDCMRKERTARGERNWNSKLTNDQIAEIKRLYAAGGTSHAKLGKQFGVVHSVIGTILRGQAWKHLLPAPANPEQGD